jgi:predicted AlkP superfamily phosphohydrolase/phosphomutase
VAERADHVLVVSDHGFRREEGKFYVNRLLADTGLLTLRRSVKRRVADLCLKMVGRERLKRLVPRRLVERAVAATENLVQPGARAFAAPLAAQGIVVADGSVRDRIIDRIRAIKDPRDGSLLATAIHRREDLYHGPGLERFPHVVLELRQGGIEVSPHVVGNESLYFVPDAWPGGHHDRRGVITAWGRGLSRGSAEPELPMVDVLPTVLHLLGLPQPEALEGRPCVLRQAARAASGEEP